MESRQRRKQAQQNQYDVYEGPFDVESKDLELLEKRVKELEQYLGIEDMDQEFFNAQDGEDIFKKTQMLEEYKISAQESITCINDIFVKFEKYDHFLKHDKPFLNQCLDLK